MRLCSGPSCLPRSFSCLEHSLGRNHIPSTPSPALANALFQFNSRIPRCPLRFLSRLIQRTGRGHSSSTVKKPFHSATSMYILTAHLHCTSFAGRETAPWCDRWVCSSDTRRGVHDGSGQGRRQGGGKSCAVSRTPDRSKKRATQVLKARRSSWSLHKGLLTRARCACWMRRRVLLVPTLEFVWYLPRQGYHTYRCSGLVFLLCP